MCVCVDRWATKSKKNLTYNMEVFHMREQDIPVDTIEIKGWPLTAGGPSTDSGLLANGSTLNK